MAFEYQPFTVAGKPFKVMKMGGMTAAKMWPRLIRILAGALERLPPGVGVALVDILAEDADKDNAVTFLLGQVGGVAGVLEELCKRLPEDEVDTWFQRLFEGGPGERKPALYAGAPILDAMEAGDVDSDVAWECVYAALRANYSAFRKGLAGVVAAGLAGAKKASLEVQTQAQGDSSASTT
jgi:hypothetical protein